MKEYDPNDRLRFPRRIGQIMAGSRLNPAMDRPALEFVRSTDFLQSREWLSLRYKALVKYGKICACCGEKGRPANPLQVDHIKPRWKYPELALDIRNLQILCMACNQGKAGWDETDHRSAA